MQRLRWGRILGMAMVLVVAIYGVAFVTALIVTLVGHIDEPLDFLRAAAPIFRATLMVVAGFGMAWIQRERTVTHLLLGLALALISVVPFLLTGSWSRFVALVMLTVVCTGAGGIAAGGLRWLNAR